MPTGLASFLSFEDVTSQASMLLRDYSQAEFPPGVLNALASNASREFARESEVVKGVDSRPLVVGSQYYTLPEDCLKVERVMMSYPGYQAPVLLQPDHEERIFDGLSGAITGQPFMWFLKPDRKSLGLWRIPVLGGFDGRTTSSGSTTVLNRTGVSTTVNGFATYAVRIMEGVCEGETSVVASNTTNGVTVSPAFSATIASGVRFQILPDTLVINYVRAGNSYTVYPTACTVENLAGGGYADPQYGVFSVTGLADRPRNFWAGCEVRFTSGSLANFKSRVTASRSKGAAAGQTELTVSPEFPALPADADALTLTDVPNTPDAYQQFLVDYVIAECVKRYKPQVYDRHIQRFHQGIAMARASNQPEHVDTYTQIRQHKRPWGRW